LTAWALFDVAIMPWSAKAQSLIQEQYAATAAAARFGLTHAVVALRQAVGWDPSLNIVDHDAQVQSVTAQPELAILSGRLPTAEVMRLADLNS